MGYAGSLARIGTVRRPGDPTAGGLPRSLGISARRSRGRDPRTPSSDRGSSWLKRRSVVLRPGNRLQTRSCGKQPQEVPPRAMVRDRGVHQCVSGHSSGTCVEPLNGAGIRQAGPGWSLIGKDLSNGRTGCGSDG